MRYDQYEKKVKAAAKTLSTVFKFRVPIIATLSVATATTVGLVSTKGIVSGAEISATEIFYGEKISLTGGSFLGSEVETEYRTFNAGDDAWSIEAPTYVGTYEARLRSPNNFGSYYYSEEFKYTIKPLDIALNVRESQTVTYGEDPSISTVDLVGKDTISECSYIYEDITAPSTRARVDLDKLVISNAFGEDVTKCYNITTEYKDINFNKRNITLNFPGAERHYDGTPLTNEEYTQTGELAFNDHFVADSMVSQSITDIGEIPNSRDVKIQNENGDDVTSQYNIVSNVGNLKVNRIKISLSSCDLDKVYNGKPFDESDFKFTQVGTLLSGDKVIVNFDDVEKSVLSERQKDACLDVPNSFTYKILNSKNEDVTNTYYDVEVAYGSINISRRPIDISYTNLKIYDRLKLSETFPIGDPDNPIYEVINGTSLADPTTEVIDVQYKVDENGVSYGERIDAGLYENGLLVFDIYSDDTLTYSVKRNYDINFDSDLFAINKQVLTIALKDQTRWYDGSTDFSKDLNTGYTIEGLVAGDQYVLNYNELDNGNSGNHKISLNKNNPVTITDPDRGNLNINKDYDIKLARDGEATLNIKAPKIDIDFKTVENLTGENNYFSFKYDGTVHSLAKLLDEGKYNFSTDDRSVSTAPEGYVDLDTPTSSTLGLEDILADGDYLKIVPESDLKTDAANEDVYEIAPDIRVIHVDPITLEETDVTEVNYNVVQHTYEFNIRYRNVELKFDESEYKFKYDGLAHNVFDSFERGAYDASLIDLNPGDYITIEGFDDVVNVADSGVMNFKIVIRDSHGDEKATNNYHISGESVTYEITPLVVDIEVDDSGFTYKYDAEQHYFDGIYRPEEGINGAPIIVGGASEFVSGHYVTIVSKERPIDADNYEVEYDLTVCDSNGDDVSGNYTFVNPSTSYEVIINQRQIDIKLFDSESLESGKFVYVYDGETRTLDGFYNANSFISTINELLPGHTLTYEDGVIYGWTDGEQALLFNIVIKDASGDDVTHNYDVEEYVYYVNVSKRDLDLEFNASEFTFQYDGKEHSIEKSREEGNYTLKNGTSIAVRDSLTVECGTVKNATLDQSGNVISVEYPFEFFLYNEDEDDVTSNYNIVSYTYSYTISPIEISGHYEAPSTTVDEVNHKISFTYDSIDRTIDTYVFESGINSTNNLADLLAAGDTIHSINSKIVSSDDGDGLVRYVNETGSILYMNSAVIYDGDEDVTSCYRFNFSEYTFEIYKLDFSWFIDYDFFANWKFTNETISANSFISKGIVYPLTSNASGDTYILSGYQKTYYGVDATPLYMEIYCVENNIPVIDNYNLLDQNGNPFVMPEYVDNYVELTVTVDTDSPEFDFTYNGVYHSIDKIYQNEESSFVSPSSRVVRTDLASLNTKYTTGYFVCDEYRNATDSSFTEGLDFRVIDSSTRTDLTFNFHITYVDKNSGVEIDEISWNISKKDVILTIPQLEGKPVNSQGEIEVPYDGETYGYGFTTGKSKYKISDSLGNDTNLYSDGLDKDYISVQGVNYTLDSFVQKNVSGTNPILVRDVVDGSTVLTLDLTNFIIFADRVGFNRDTVTNNYNIVITPYKVRIVPVTVDICFNSSAQPFNFVFSGESYNFSKLFTDKKVDYLVNRDFEEFLSNKLVLTVGTQLYDTTSSEFIDYEAWEYVYNPFTETYESGTYRPVFNVMDGSKDVTANFTFIEHTYAVNISKYVIDIDFSGYINANDLLTTNTNYFNFEFDNSERSLNDLIDQGRYMVNGDRPGVTNLPLNVSIEVSNDKVFHNFSDSGSITPTFYMFSSNVDFSKNFLFTNENVYTFSISKINISFESDLFKNFHISYPNDGDNYVTSFTYGDYAIDVDTDIRFDTSTNTTLRFKDFTGSINVGTNFDGHIIKYYNENAYQYYVESVDFIDKYGNSLLSENFSLVIRTYSIFVNKINLFYYMPSSNIQYSLGDEIDFYDFFHLDSYSSPYHPYLRFNDYIIWDEITIDKRTDGTISLDGKSAWFDDDVIIYDYDGNDVSYNYIVDNEALRDIKFEYGKATINFEINKYTFYPGVPIQAYVNYDGEYHGYLDYELSSTGVAKLEKLGESWGWKEGHVDALRDYQIAYFSKSDSSLNSVLLDFDIIKEYIVIYNSEGRDITSSFDLAGENYLLEINSINRELPTLSYTSIVTFDRIYKGESYSISDDEYFNDFRWYLDILGDTLEYFTFTGDVDSSNATPGKYLDVGNYNCTISGYKITHIDPLTGDTVDVSDCYNLWFDVKYADSSYHSYNVVNNYRFNFNLKYSYLYIDFDQQVMNLTYDGKVKKAEDFTYIIVEEDYLGRDSDKRYPLNNLSEFKELFPEFADVDFAKYCSKTTYKNVITSIDGGEFSYSTWDLFSENAVVNDYFVKAHVDIQVIINKRQVAFDLNQEDFASLAVIDGVYTTLYTGKGYGYAEGGNFITTRGTSIAEGDRIIFKSSTGDSPLIKNVGKYDTDVIGFEVWNGTENVTYCYENIGGEFNNYKFEIKKLVLKETYKKLDNLIDEGKRVDGVISVSYDNTKYSIADYGFEYIDIYGEKVFIAGDELESLFDNSVTITREEISDARKRVLRKVETSPFTFNPGELTFSIDGGIVSASNLEFSQNTYILRILPLEVSIYIDDDFRAYTQFYFDGTKHSLQDGFDRGLFNIQIGTDKNGDPILVSSDYFVTNTLQDEDFPNEIKVRIGERLDNKPYQYYIKADSDKKGTENTNISLYYISSVTGNEVEAEQVSNFIFSNQSIEWKVFDLGLIVRSDDFDRVVLNRYEDHDDIGHYAHADFVEEQLSKEFAPSISVIFDGEMHGYNTFHIYPSLVNPDGDGYIIDKDTEYSVYEVSYSDGVDRTHKVFVNDFTIYFNIDTSAHAEFVKDTKATSKYIQYMVYDSIIIKHNITKEILPKENYGNFFKQIDHYNLTILPARVDEEFLDSNYFSFEYDGEVRSFDKALKENNNYLRNELDFYFMSNFGVQTALLNVTNKTDITTQGKSTVNKEHADMVRNVFDVELANNAPYVISPKFATYSFYWGDEYCLGDMFENFMIKEYFYTYEISKRPLEFTFNVNDENGNVYSLENREYFYTYDGNEVNYQNYILANPSQLASSDLELFNANYITIGGEGSIRYVIKDKNTDALKGVEMILDPSTTTIMSYTFDYYYNLRETLVSIDGNYDLSGNYENYGTPEQKWKSWTVTITPVYYEYFATGYYRSGATNILLQQVDDYRVEVSYEFDGNSYTMENIFRSSNISKILYSTDFAQVKMPETISSIKFDGKRVKYVDDNRSYAVKDSDITVTVRDPATRETIDISDSYNFADVIYTVYIKPHRVVFNANNVSCVLGSDFDEICNNSMGLKNPEDNLYGNVVVDAEVNPDFVDFLKNRTTSGTFSNHYDGDDSHMFNIEIYDSSAASSSNPNGNITNCYTFDVSVSFKLDKISVRLASNYLTIGYTGREEIPMNVSIEMKSDSTYRSKNWLATYGKGTYTVEASLVRDDYYDDLKSVGVHRLYVDPSSVVVRDANGLIMSSDSYSCDILGEEVVYEILPVNLYISSSGASSNGDGTFTLYTLGGVVLDDVNADESLVISNIQSGDRVLINGIQYNRNVTNYNLIDYSSIREGDFVSFTPKEYMIRILDSKGNDVSGNYNIIITESVLRCVFEELAWDEW